MGGVSQRLDVVAIVAVDHEGLSVDTKKWAKGSTISTSRDDGPACSPNDGLDEVVGDPAIGRILYATYCINQ
jgi:hypothetical protein